MVKFRKATLEDLHKRSHNTMAEWLGITFTEIGENTLTAIMPVDKRTHQPMGILHGGANAALAETLGSVAANLALESSDSVCVGLEINANHLRSVSSGLVTGHATPIHVGKSTHVWEIRITDSEGRLTCVSRLTLAVVKRQ